MAYNTFTMEDLKGRLGLTRHEVRDTFEAYPSVGVSAFLQQALDRGLPIALGVGREKARSEAIIYPILTEVRELLARSVSLFSGPRFDVDRKRGLAGYCDFLLSASPAQLVIEAPVVAVVEVRGVSQAVAAMYGAQLFNARRDRHFPTVYGATTSGTAWRFLRLTGAEVEMDLTEYHIREVGKVLGILTGLLRGGGDGV